MKQAKAQSQTNNHIDTSELPKLSLHIIKSAADFEKEIMSLEVKGWTMQECVSGMNYLIDQARRINNANNKDKAEDKGPARWPYG